MKAQQLKNSILQMAIQGKLVPQDPNDEPASVLLERIRKEKEQMIKEGKIKKEKNPSVIFKGSDNLYYEKVGKEIKCIQDDLPFDIPDNWHWCRLGEIATVIRGLTFSSWSKEKKDRFSLVLRGGNIDSKTELLTFNDNIYVDDNIIKDIQYLKEGDTLIVASSGTKSSVGKSCYIDTNLQSTSFGGFMMAVRPNKQIVGQYVAINIKLYRQKIIASTAGYISNIANPILNNLLIPLPPEKEQKFIIKKINELLPFVYEYDAKESELSKLNDSFLELLKKSILQQAIQGKLVPQDPNDEPASVLLERIRKEKQQLIKEGKIKKDKNESFIYRRDNSHYEKLNGIERCIDDEIPFDIPETWSWARISSIGTIVRGNGIKRTETVKNGKPCVRYGELYTTYNISFEQTVSFVSDELYKKCKYISKDDILITLTGENKPDIAKSVAYLGTEKIAAGGDLAFWTNHGMNPLYLVAFMASPYAINQKVELSTGDIIVHISKEKIGSFLIPIPPLSEQQKIVNKYIDFLNLLQKL